MFSVHSGRRAVLLTCVVLLTVAMLSPATAQTTGMVMGKVVDVKGQPVDGAKVTIEFKDGRALTYNVKTNKKGDYTQIGLAPGNYKVTAEKEKVGIQAFDVRVKLGETLEVNFKLDPAGGGSTKEDAAKVAAIRKEFDEGVALSRSGDHDGALAKFYAAIEIAPACYDCYYNIGYSESQKFDEAQAASQKAAELAMAGGVAGGAGGVDALYNVGVTAWNAGKAEEAKKAFEEALKLDPKHANSHYQLAMCLINMGKIPEAVTEFEAYLENAPDGQYAAQVKAMLAQLKK
jgi:tetratricopeptide (TPR) repeat protein